MGLFEGFKFDVVIKLLAQGMLTTIEVTVLSLLLAVVIGLLSCLSGMSKVKPLKWISKFYVWIIRGTPFIVQLFLIHFGVPEVVRALTGARFSFAPFMSATITLGLNAGAYISEIFRGGISAIDRGQMEAARSLGLSKGRAMIKVILPQAFKISVPSLCNQFIITLKDSSLASIIALEEITLKGNLYAAKEFKYFATYLMIGIAYLIIITILSTFIKMIERRLDVGNKG